MELKFVATTRPEKLSPTVQRRQKLVRRIDQQIGYVRQMIEGQQPRAAWVWMDGFHQQLLSFLEESLRGKTVVQVGKLISLRHV